MEFIARLGSFLWGTWTPWGLLAAGLIFTVWTRFTQYTAMTHGIAVIQGRYDRPDDPGAINHFQALSAALSATIGLGNIGGVALAIGIGGPGALLWMWLVGVLGMALKTVEITLAMMYRNTDDPANPHGGAMWVVHHVIGDKGGIWRPIGRGIGIFFCITLIISAFTGGNMFQSWNVASLTEGYFGVPRIATGILIALIVGLVIIGGIKRIGTVAARLVPFMCILYVLSALAVLAVHVADIPAMFHLIVTSAFRTNQASGAFIGGSMGFAFMQGMKRALFSNEAGQGSAPIAHSAARTNEPAREGIVGGIGPFIDTICICTLTALVIISTGTWNRAAIGDFGSEIRLVPDRTAEEPTWKVEASTDPANLPVQRLGEWTPGAQFFLVAQVEGARNRESRRTRTMVTGKIVEQASPTNPEASAGLSIQWDDVVLPPSRWSGTPTGVVLVDRGVHRTYDGARLTSHAFDRAFPGLGKWLVTLAAWLFAVSTMISWSYYGEQGVIYIMGNAGVLAYKLLYLAGAIYAAQWITDTREMTSLMDLGTGAMLWSNIPIVLGLGFLAVRCLADYKRRLRTGEFHPHRAPRIEDIVRGKPAE
jgi:AGCS family alanine or glycine:cation symporter